MIFGRWKNQADTNARLESTMALLDKALKSSFINVRRDVSHMQKWVAYLHESQDRISVNVGKLDSRMADAEAKLTNFLTREEIKSFVDEYYRTVDSMHTHMRAMHDQVTSHLTGIYGNQKTLFERLATLSRHTHEEIRREITTKLSAEIAVLSADVMQRLDGMADKKSTFERIDELNKRVEAISALPATIPTVKDASRESQDKDRYYKPQVSSLKEKILRKVSRHSKDYVRGMLISLIHKYGKISGLGLREIVVEEQGIVSKSSFYRLLAEIEDTEDSITVVQEGKDKHYLWMAAQASHVS